MNTNDKVKIPKGIFLVVFAILLLLLISTTIKLHNQKTKLESYEEEIQFYKDHPVTKTDTSYTKKIEDVLPSPFKFKVTPSKTLINNKTVFPQHTFTSHQVSQNNDTAHYQSQSNSSQIIPTGDSGILGFLLDKNKLTISFYNDTSIFSNEYKINPDNYKYSLYQGTLTSEKRKSSSRKLKLQPYAEVQYRPIHNLWDVNAGIELQTTHLNYSVHINGFYYPGINTQGIDVSIGIRYNF